MEKVVVLGASEKPWRFSFKAVRLLKENGHEVIPIGRTAGRIGDQLIYPGQPEIENVDTISLYLNSENSSEIADYILGLAPRRIIFNPGAENQDLASRAVANGIAIEYGCTLVMLSNNTFEMEEKETSSP